MLFTLGIELGTRSRWCHDAAVGSSVPCVSHCPTLQLGPRAMACGALQVVLALCIVCKARDWADKSGTSLSGRLYGATSIWVEVVEVEQRVGE